MIKKSDEIREKLKRYYQSADQYVNRISSIDRSAYQEYVSFICRYGRRGSYLLELGCGPGSSSLMLNQNGFRVMGLDISPLFLKEAKNKKCEGLEFIAGDILDLPFSNDSFDIVSCFLTIEHLTDVPRALEEMARVTKSRGLIIILSPNLLSPFNQLNALKNILLKKRNEVLFLGKTNPSLIMVDFFRNIVISIIKILSSRPHFLYRMPVLENRFNFIPDMDAVYLANPLDLKHWFQKKEGFQIVKYQGEGISGRLLPDFGSGIHLVVRKNVF